MNRATPLTQETTKYETTNQRWCNVAPDPSFHICDLLVPSKSATERLDTNLSGLEMIDPFLGWGDANN